MKTHEDFLVKMTEKLLPCPACLTENPREMTVRELDKITYWTIECSGEDCFFTVGNFIDHENAIAAWNHRAS